jgi:hypothetical protein
MVTSPEIPRVPNDIDQSDDPAELSPAASYTFANKPPQFSPLDDFTTSFHKSGQPTVRTAYMN